MHSVLKVIVLIPFCIEFTNVMMLSKQGSLPASFPYRLTKGEGKTELKSSWFIVSGYLSAGFVFLFFFVLLKYMF